MSPTSTRGYSLLEVLAVISIMVIVGGAAVPLGHGGAERARASGAASYLAGRLAVARLEAVRRSTNVAIRFIPTAGGYSLRAFVDGNGNGVLTSDIVSGIDPPISPEEQIDNHFSGVSFGILPNVTAIDPNDPFNPNDPIQIGASTLVSFGPTGSSTSGTLFLRGSGGHQLAVRLLGITGRTRILRFSFVEGRWFTH